MTRLLLWGTLAACVVGVLGVQSRQQSVLRSQGDVARVFVAASDRDGRLVTTLAREGLQVRDARMSQPIALFDNTPHTASSLGIVEAAA